MSAMAKIWRNRIEAGTQFFSDCPEKYKDEVKELMIEDVEDGRLSQEEFERLMEM